MVVIEEEWESSESIEAAERLKKEGNSRFGEGDWAAAELKYKVRNESKLPLLLLL